MSDGATVTFQVHLGAGPRTQKEIRLGAAPPAVAPPPGRIPRVARLMALAIRFERLVRSGEVRDYAEIARLGHVTRARMSQITNLLNLAPDIQEAILFLPRVAKGDVGITERHLRPIVACPDWREQRRMWKSLTAEA
ncbi:MAG: hypothetical protein FJ102_20660 [Deltaproteobacteria bacterium]|nr:hypothetical protein [Deltaproteobacteria bacterium]